MESPKAKSGDQSPLWTSSLRTTVSSFSSSYSALPENASPPRESSVLDDEDLDLHNQDLPGYQEMSSISVSTIPEHLCIPDGPPRQIITSSFTPLDVDDLIRETPSSPPQHCNSTLDESTVTPPLEAIDEEIESVKQPPQTGWGRRFSLLKNKRPKKRYLFLFLLVCLVAEYYLLRRYGVGVVQEPFRVLDDVLDAAGMMDVVRTRFRLLEEVLDASSYAQLVLRSFNESNPLAYLSQETQRPGYRLAQRMAAAQRKLLVY